VYKIMSLFRQAFDRRQTNAAEGYITICLGPQQWFDIIGR